MAWPGTARRLRAARFQGPRRLVNCEGLDRTSRLAIGTRDLRGRVEQGSFSGFNAASDATRMFFDCFFYSVLNFSFFGFGDIMPQTIPARIVTLLEVVLAFFTVIFLLSDFISLKDSLRRERHR